ncbi:3-phosphoshikimate 1-carboxyvinyltransferase, partial [bacterium]|nr:3-phosphoshikimate 1-carboxyvinyltransferase [bacterium]
EKLLLLSGAKLNKIGDKIEITGNVKLNNFKITVPSDISSASFFIASSLLSQNGNIKIDNVGINEHRIGFLKAVQKMNGFMEIKNIRANEASEPIGTIIAKTSDLKGIEITSKDVPSMIDELPILAVLATQAEGKTKITGAGELRKKESDRIFSMCCELKKMGANIKELEDGFEIEGKTKLKGSVLESHGDHRVAMSLIIASTISNSPCEINGVDCINISYPNFIKTLEKLTK